MITTKAWHALPPDYQAFDEVYITTIPRLKQSGLSGDEWRISARVKLIRKGRLIAEKHFRNVDTAIRYLDYVANVAVAESGACALNHPDYKDLCDQEGCQQKATVFYKMKSDYCNEGHPKQPFADVIYRQFCERHKYRGDCSRDDCDDNYIPIEDPNQ